MQHVLNGMLFRYEIYIRKYCLKTKKAKKTKKTKKMQQKS